MRLPAYILTALVFLASFASAAQAAPGKLTYRITAKPGKVTQITKRSRLTDVNQIDIRVRGRYYAMGTHSRRCELDAVAKRVLVTINACRKRRITVSVATTAKRRSRVVVVLAEVFTGENGTRDGDGSEPEPAPEPVEPVESEDDEEADAAPVEPDSDGDSTPDHRDNCPENFNPSQDDMDSDGIGNVCDPTPWPPTPTPESP